MAKAKKDTQVKETRVRIPQSRIPRLTLQESIRIAQALYDDFAGKSAQPHQLAMATDLSPTSSGWQYLCGASLAYGLTEGGYNAARISLTSLGKKLVAPTREGEDQSALLEAVLAPTILKQFFQKYDRAKFPSDKIAQNVLVEMGVPQQRVDEALDIVKRNGEFTGIIHQTKTGPFVAIETSVQISESSKEEELVAEIDEPGIPGVEPPGPPKPIESEQLQTQKVFVSHGKNKSMVSQLKELLTFGKLEPIVAVEREATSIPVPDKVLNEMRQCFAGIIHVESEEELLDTKGNTHHKLNENVLIEIGASFALYGKNVILLVQKGITLPSNLQGLYRCDYEGEKLDYEATMKLLKAFNELQ